MLPFHHLLQVLLPVFGTHRNHHAPTVLQLFQQCNVHFYGCSTETRQHTSGCHFFKGVFHYRFSLYNTPFRIASRAVFVHLGFKIDPSCVDHRDPCYTLSHCCWYHIRNTHAHTKKEMRSTYTNTEKEMRNTRREWHRMVHPLHTRYAHHLTPRCSHERKFIAPHARLPTSTRRNQICWYNNSMICRNVTSVRTRDVLNGTNLRVVDFV